VELTLGTLGGEMGRKQKRLVYASSPRGLGSLVRASEKDLRVWSDTHVYTRLYRAFSSAF
jgi:hypothetical protein